jgi:lipoprotein LpqS
MMPPRAATVGNIVRYDDGRTRTRRRRTIALGVGILALAISVEWTLPWMDPPAAHAPHALAAASHAGFAVITDHPHMQDASTPAVPDKFTAAISPRATTTLMALGLITAVAILASCWGTGVWTAVRGPPNELACVLAGRQLLTRFCIARR